MTTAPSGTLTFLFTDIEGSTRLWEEQGEAMQAILARHDALVRSGIEAHGGYVFKTMGDAFCATFCTPTEALLASLHLHAALAKEETLASLRVRMAMHTGTAEHREGDYFGPPLNRVARLLSAGHGGQVLLSGVTQELVRDDLPAGMELRDLGEHRLKDLTRPEHVFQLTMPGLPDEFPPLRGLDAHPHNLPLQPTPLIGREREIREIAERMRQNDVRLLTLTGPGGTGKTRLALHAAADLTDGFGDGVFFVNLAPLTDPDVLPSSIAQVLGVHKGAERPLHEYLAEHLREKNLLLLLDNFEQIAPAAPFVAQLLAGSTRLKVLATSRVPLHLRGEQEYPVPPLSLPDQAGPPDLERLTQCEAVRLFLERAQAVKPDFQVTNESAPAVAEICHRLDGLPLAIELAAARIRILPPQAMLARLRSPLRLLTGGARDLPARHQTLRDTIEWSYLLLGEEEKVLFRRLGVFCGGAALEAIEQICNPEGDPSGSPGQAPSAALPAGLDVLEIVSSLVEKSLLRQEERAAGEPRIMMLETIREYARERLGENEEAGQIGRRHAEFFLALAEEAHPRLAGPEQGRWLARLETEHDNLRAALRHLLEHRETELAGRFAASLWRFWAARSHVPEGFQWLREVLSAEGLSPRTRAQALYGAGVLARWLADLTAAEQLLEECLSLSRELEDARGTAGALAGLGMVCRRRGDVVRAEAFFEEALAGWRALGDRGYVSVVLNNLGMMAFERKDHARAEALLQSSLALGRAVANPGLTSIALQNLGNLARRRGDPRQAVAHLREGLQLALEAGDVQYGSSALAYLAQAMHAAGEAEVAARLFGVAEARAAVMDTDLEPSERADYERNLAAARDRLPPEAWERFFREGAAMSLEEAIAYALEEAAESEEPAPRTSDTGAPE